MAIRDSDTPAPLRLKAFLRSLSYREFVTAICLTLLYFAFSEVADFYSEEPLFLGRTTPLKYLFVVVLMISQHVFYKIDHKRPNTMLARGICDYGFIIAMMLVSWALSFFDLHKPLSVDSFGLVLALIIAFAFMIFFFELGVALLKRLLALLKWQIL